MGKKKTEVKAVEVKEEVVVQEPSVEETAEVGSEVEVVAETTEEPKKEKKVKVPALPPMTNAELKALFIENGCKAESGAKDTSSVVYQQWGTKSRVLQQSKAYQLLLTNGHKKEKDQVVVSDNDDVARFQIWYDTLTEEQKAGVIGYGEMLSTKLSASEMPRERQVKLSNKELLIGFIQYMAGFDENRVTPTKTE